MQSIRQIRRLVKHFLIKNLTVTVADPDPQISGGGGGVGHPDPETSGGGGLQKKVFSALRASVWYKNKGGPGPPRAPPLDPPLSKHGLSRRTTEDTLPLHWRRLLPV